MLKDKLEKYPPGTVVKCYSMVYLPTSRFSISQLEARLPILEKIALQEKEDPVVIEKILTAIEVFLPERDQTQFSESEEQILLRMKAVYNSLKARKTPAKGNL